MVLESVPGASSRLRTALWVVPVADIGGVARHVLDVARVGLPGWRLVVLCPEGPLSERLRALGCAVIAAPFGPEAGFATSLATLRLNMRRLRPDVVHSHLSYADVVAAAAVLWPGTRLVTTEHGIAGNDLVYHGSAWKSRVKAIMHRVRLRRADAVIAVSEATKNAMVTKWKPKQHIAVIPNGVDAAAVFQQVEALRRDTKTVGEGTGQLRILSLSRLAPEKRLDVLLRAFALVRQSDPTATLKIAGEGPERKALEQLATQLGVAPNVEFAGFVDPLVAMAESEVLVQLSVWENCSYTLLDAVSAGLGVVATPVGGNPEILPEHCLVPALDYPAVAASIVKQGRRSGQLSLREDWPDLVDMTRQVVSVYCRKFPQHETPLILGRRNRGGTG